ncbi:MAG TPA: 2-dehydropantoate 2-reductase [Burkholderiales bacterium]
MPEHSARVLVLGAGALGAFYGGVLARAGCAVEVVARSDYDAVAANGYRIDSTLGDLSFRPARVLRAAQAATPGADFVVVGLKLVPGADRVALLRPVLGPASVIVLVQNGIGIEDEVAGAFPSHEIVSGVAYAAASRLAPGHVRHHSKFTRLILGRYPAGEGDGASRFAALLKAGGASVQVSEDIVGARWQKCAWNTVFNPISALGGGLGTSDMLSGEAQVAFARAAIEEVCAVAAADGHPLPADTAATQIQGTLKLPNYVSSMGQDALAGRPMETEALLGNVVRLARRLSVPVPRLEALYAMLKMMEARAPKQAAPG